MIGITERVYVLRDGLVVGELPASAADTGQLQRLMVGRELQEDYYFRDRQVAPSTDHILVVEGLSVNGVLLGRVV